jgi:hypothetical protein
MDVTVAEICKTTEHHFKIYFNVYHYSEQLLPRRSPYNLRFCCEFFLVHCSFAVRHCSNAFHLTCASQLSLFHPETCTHCFMRVMFLEWSHAIANKRGPPHFWKSQEEGRCLSLSVNKRRAQAGL